MLLGRTLILPSNLLPYPDPDCARVHTHIPSHALIPTLALATLTAGVRFLLACVKVQQSAPFYHRYIARNDLFKHVFECFFSSQADDMLQASICNLVEAICVQNSKVLVKYIVKQYGEQFGVGVRVVESVDEQLRGYVVL